MLLNKEAFRRLSLSSFD